MKKVVEVEGTKIRGYQTWVCFYHKVNSQPRGKFKDEIFVTADEGIHLIEEVPEEAGGNEIEPR